MNDKGPNDLEHLLAQRTEEVNMLKKQKELLQRKCIQAGQTIKTLTKEIDRLSEERDNFKRIYESK